MTLFKDKKWAEQTEGKITSNLYVGTIKDENTLEEIFFYWITSTMLAWKLIWYFSFFEKKKRIKRVEEGIQFSKTSFWSFHCFHFSPERKHKENELLCFSFKIKTVKGNALTFKAVVKLF